MWRRGRYRLDRLVRRREVDLGACLSAAPRSGPGTISIPASGNMSRAAPEKPLACRVEERRGSLGHAASLRFLSPLIEPDMGAPIRLSDKTSGVRSRKAMSRRLQFDEPQGLVEVLVRKACSPCAANLMLRA